MNKDELTAVLARLNEKQAEASNTILDAEKQIAAAKVALTKMESDAADLYITHRLTHQSISNATHLLDGKCAHMVRDRESRWHPTYSPCDNKAKSECPKCGGPFCGVHGREQKHGGYAHYCEAWRQTRVKLLSVLEGASAN